MDEIVITGIRAYGYHGVFESEKRDGQEFLVDLKLKLDLSNAGSSDALPDTVDYSAIAVRTRGIIEHGSFNLIERLAAEIATKLKAEFAIESIEVTVHKPHALIPIDFTDVSVTIRR